MKGQEIKKKLIILVLTFGLIFCQAEVAEGAQVGTEFTCQGRLIDANSILFMKKSGAFLQSVKRLEYTLYTRSSVIPDTRDRVY